MDRGVWQTTVHGVAKSWTQLRELTPSLSHIPNVQSLTQMHTHWVKPCFKLYVICLSLLPQNMGTTLEALRECPTTSSASASMMNHPYNSKPRCSQL